jgi:hypothetical protein
MRHLSELMTEPGRAEFLRCFAAKIRWQGRVSEQGGLKALFGWEVLDTALRSPGFPTDRLRVMVDEQRVGDALYLDAKTGSLRPDALQSLAEQGATLVVDGISRVVGALADLARGIERELSGSVNCSAYVSFGERSAFLPHFDDHDVLIVHLQGSKAWCGYGQNQRFPVRRGPTQRVGAPEWETVLEAGDLLYLPRGEVHAAVPVVWPSVHLTIGIGERTGVDFVKALGETAGAHELFRRSLSRTDTAEQESELKGALHALIDAASLDDFLAQDDEQRRLKPVAAFNFGKRLAPDTRLASALLRRIDLRPDDPREVKLTLGGQPVRLAQIERSALNLLTRCDQMSFAELAQALGDTGLATALTTLATLALIEIR